MKFLSMRYPTFLLLVLAGAFWACGQEKPDTTPVINVEKPAVDPQAFPPPVTVQSDRSNWREAQYGSKPLILMTEKKMPNTGEQVPENARVYIEENDTWSANLGEDLQMVLNMVTYKPDVRLDLGAIHQFALGQFRDNPAVSGMQSRPGTISVPGAGGSARLDGILFRDGLYHYFCVITALKDQTVWQLSMIYPETYEAGPGDVEAIAASMRMVE